MVELIITQTVTPTNGQAIPFTSVKQNTNGNMSANAATGQVTVLQPGIYEISGTITATIGAEGNVTVQALGNGTFIPQIQAEFSAAAADEIVTMPFEGTVEIVSATTGNAVLTFVPLAGSVAFTISSADIVIKSVS